MEETLDRGKHLILGQRTIDSQPRAVDGATSYRSEPDEFAWQEFHGEDASACQAPFRLKQTLGAQADFRVGQARVADKEERQAPQRVQFHQRLVRSLLPEAMKIAEPAGELAKSKKGQGSDDLHVRSAGCNAPNDLSYRIGPATRRARGPGLGRIVGIRQNSPNETDSGAVCPRSRRVCAAETGKERPVCCRGSLVVDRAVARAH